MRTRAVDIVARLVRLACGGLLLLALASATAIAREAVSAPASQPTARVARTATATGTTPPTSSASPAWTAAGAAVSSGGAATGTADGAGAAVATTPTNVIVMIGDGMGFDAVAAADLYDRGRVGVAPFENWPVRLAMSTYSARGSYDPARAWSDPRYVLADPTDSAAAATALSTGVKTYGGAIGVDVAKRPVGNVVEEAHGLGKATGVVTSVEFADATPAGFVAHAPWRTDTAGIANQMLRGGDLDVVAGTGDPHFDSSGRRRTGAGSFEWVGGQATWDALAAGRLGGDSDGDGLPDPFTLVQTRAAVQALAAGPTPARVAIVPQVSLALQEYRGGSAYAKPYAVPFTPTVPTLAEETKAALNVLDDRPAGFFLMVEGGAIDKAAHANQTGRLIEEENQFFAAVAIVKTWVAAHGGWSRTLVIVTADHETGYLTGPGGSSRTPPAGRGAGSVPALRWNAGAHTNSLVPLYANGAGAARLVPAVPGRDPVRGDYVDNAEVGTSILALVR